MSESRIERIRHTLEAAFAPEELEIVDESHKHVGHASAKGGGHYIVRIVSKRFAEQPTIQRHRMVYEAMGELMQSEVHALSIQARSPGES